MLEPLVSPHKRTLVHPDIRCKVLAENRPEPGASCRGNFKPRLSDMFLVLWLAGLVVATATGEGGIIACPRRFCLLVTVKSVCLSQVIEKRRQVMQLVPFKSVFRVLCKGTPMCEELRCTTFGRHLGWAFGNAPSNRRWKWKHCRLHPLHQS